MRVAIDRAAFPADLVPRRRGAGLKGVGGCASEMHPRERPSRRAFGAPQRLCWRSSGFWAPWLFVSQDGVEDGEEFTGRGDGDEHFGLAGVDEALAKGLEDRIVMAGGEACEKKGGAHGPAAAGHPG